MKNDILDQLLHAAYMASMCQKKNTGCDMGQTVGELDWVSEIARLREEIRA